MGYNVNKINNVLHLKKNKLFYLMGSALCLWIMTTATATWAAEGFSGNLKGVSITDADATNQPPVAQFTYTQDGQTFTFDASDSYDSDGNIIEYKWDFGDGSSGTGISPAHAYTDLTSSRVSLILVDNNDSVTIYQQQVSLSSCQTQSTDVSYTSTKRSTTDIFGEVVYGQSFTPNSTGEIYSIKVVTSYIPNPSSATLMIRVGNTPDLSTNYDTAETVPLEGYIGGDVIEINFTTKPTIISGQTKYFMIYNTGEYNSRFKLYRNNSSGYTGGSEYSSKTGLADVSTGSGDLSFEVIVCD